MFAEASLFAVVPHAAERALVQMLAWIKGADAIVEIDAQFLLGGLTRASKWPLGTKRAISANTVLQTGACMKKLVRKRTA